MKYLLFVLCLSGLAQTVLAEMQTLRFSNGDRISGEVLAESETHVTLITHFGQQMVIPHELLETGVPEVAPEEIAALLEPKAVRDWTSHVELNSAFSRGNTDSELINLQAEYELERGRQRYSVDFSSLREQKEGDQVKEQDRLNLGYNYLYAENWFFAINGTIEQDPVALLEHRISLNPGLGYDIWNETGRTLNIQLGAGYSSERTDETDESSSLVDWRLHYAQQILDGALEVFHKHQIYRNLQGRRNTVFNSQSGVRYELNDYLYVNVQLNYDYDTEPAQDTDAEDVTFLVGAGVTL